MENKSVKPTPIRKCTGCGEHFPKNSLVRIVRLPEGDVILDVSGKASGRGAYICKNAACLKKARKSRRIESSLDCRISDELYTKMEEELTVG